MPGKMFKKIKYDYEGKISNKVEKPYVSSEEPCMEKEQLREYLHKEKLL